jgi:2-isopropylmalate synthase
MDHVGIDWHGHNDRGLGVTNNIRAIEAGADRIHGTALGVGERVGNASMDQTLFNLKLLGEIDKDLTKLLEYCQTVSETFEVSIHPSYPLAGRDAFRTATGVHAAAIIKAEKKGDDDLADRIYSGVPAGLFGKKQCIEIGPMSGVSNVIYWLKTRDIDPEEALVRHIFEAVKQKNHVLSEEEVHALINEHRA